MSTCVFCKRSDGKPAQEHVFPRWLSRAGSDGGSYSVRRGSKIIRTPLIEVVTKRVCEDCNTGWMRRIEDSAKPIFEPLLEGTAMRITDVERWIIARWFTKTILTAQLALTTRSQEGPLPLGGYRDFYDQPQPFQNLFILMSGYQGLLLPIRFEMHPPDSSTDRGSRVFFHFQRIVLLAFVMDTGKPASLILPHRFDTFSHVMWPAQRGLMGSGDPTMPVTWPPSNVLDESSIGILRGMISNQPISSD